MPPTTAPISALFTRCAQALEERTGEDLLTRIDELRNDQRSWRYIVEDLERETGVTVSVQTVINWHARGEQ